MQIILYPAIVQGEAAVESIIRGIHALEQQKVDVMIVGRGGGSIEDLWAFNDRNVAQAVFDCSIPIISAVGHETDTTIIDYVSDLRAPTPSAAAELAVPDIRAILNEMSMQYNALQRLMQRHLQTHRDRLHHYERLLKYVSPESRIRDNKRRSMLLEEQLQERMEAVLERKRHQMAIYIEKLKGLSPLEKLSSGFSYVENEQGHNIRSVKQTQPGEQITIRVRDGSIDARVTALH